MIRDFGDINAWATGKIVKTEGSGVGMIRHIEFNSDIVMDRCEAQTHNDAQMSFSYRLLESPWPISDYVATVIFSSIGQGKTPD